MIRDPGHFEPNGFGPFPVRVAVFYQQGLMWRIQKVFNIGPGPDGIPGTFDDEHINDGWVMSTHPAELPGHFNQADVDQYFADRPTDFFRVVPSRLWSNQSNRTNRPHRSNRSGTEQGIPVLLLTNNKPASCLTTRSFIRGTLPSRYSLTRLLCLIPCHWLRSLTAASGGNRFLTIMVNRCLFLSQRFTSPPFKTLTSI